MTVPRKSAAARAEATKTPAEFAYDGEVYSIAPAREWDLDAIEALEDGRTANAVRLILGNEQWRRFRSKPRKLDDLNDLMDEATKAGGIEGN